MADKETASQQSTPVRDASKRSSESNTESRWDALRSTIRKQWPLLSNSDLAMIDGDSRKLVALVHQKTGADVSEIEAKIDEIASNSEGLLDRLTKSVQAVASQAAQSVSGPAMHAYNSVEEHVSASPIRSCSIAFGTGVVIGVCTASMLKDAWAPRRQSMFDLW